MARLSIRLLGPLQVTLDGKPVTGFESDKVRALLAYLAAEADRPHRRETLAALLWPDSPERAARTNLRHVLANLRQAIGDRQATSPFLTITRQTIQFNSTGDAWVDVQAFGETLTAQERSSQQLEEAVTLYRGDFLEGFSLADSAAFDDWVLLRREQLSRQAVVVLQRMAENFEQHGEYEQALSYAWRQVELEPWQEAAHRQLLRLLTFSGQRHAALTQYETLRRQLAAELGVEPEAETTRLYDRIRVGELDIPPPLPAFLDEAEKGPEVERPVLVARRRELERLDGIFEKALAGQGRAAFIVGEAGSGKTALVQGFARRAQEVHPDLIVVNGNCNAHTGIGDPYLPFREVLGLLTGDVENRWAAGAITREHARRLWQTLPLTAQALAEVGAHLIDVFIPGAALLTRAVACSPGGSVWVDRLRELVERETPEADAPSPQQSDLFEQYTKVLQTLARQRPLLLVLDDLQWGDPGSISLLFHLGRRLAGSRILILGAYRPSEIALDRDGARHPLEPVVNELRRDYGDVIVNLRQAERRDFVEAFLDSEPNRLSVMFRETLYRQTNGQPLFTTELLRGMQARGDLVQDDSGRWVTGAALDWETMPPRVEAVIAERIGRLPAASREALAVAGVEGETFTAEVVARVLAADAGEMVRRLSGELDRQQRLVRAQSIQQMSGGRRSQYRFRHILFQKYLYDNLDEAERAYLHEAVGTALEALHGEQTEQVAVQLARHFREAGALEKAITYLHQAGERAVHLSANVEAIAHFNQALGLLESTPDTPVRAERELVLQIALTRPLRANKGHAAPEVGQALRRARELCQQLGEDARLFQISFWLLTFHMIQGDHREQTRAMAEDLLNHTERHPGDVARLQSHGILGLNLLTLGELASARTHLEQAITLYDIDQHRTLAFTYGQDPGVMRLSNLSWVLWLLGYPEQAMQRAEEAVALGRVLSHPFSLSYALGFLGTLHQFRADAATAQIVAQELVTIATEHEFPIYLWIGNILAGWALVEQGKAREGRQRLRQGLDNTVTNSRSALSTCWPAMLVEAYAKTGQAAEGLRVLDEMLASVAETEERFYEAEVRRLKGELLLQGSTEEVEAEGHFQQAVEIARRQSAKSLELRATVSLARLWHSRRSHGKTADVRKMLAEIYGWFTEGFDTVDLREAKTLLEELV